MSVPHDGADVELLALVERVLELRDSGQSIDLVAICSHRPDLIEGVRRALDLAGDLRELQAEATQRDVHLGSVLGARYRLERRIGAGSMGVVYQAVDCELGRAVAVKVLSSHCMAEAEAKARFLREGEVLAAIAHPAVVTVFDRGCTAAGDHFLVMELLEGLDGRQWIERARTAAAKHGIQALDNAEWSSRTGKLPGLPERGWLRSVVLWVADLATGLAVAHAAGVRHRDIKPSNVLVRRDGRPVLLDFGIASRHAEATLALRDKVVGTPAFLAPELLAPGAGSGSVAGDVYGLGALLYNLLTLRAPYEGSVPQVLARIARHDPVPAGRLRPLSRDLEAILDRALERDPRRRYATATDLAADLQAFLTHRPVVARPISPLARIGRRLARSREVRVGVGVGLVLATVAGGFAWNAAAAARRQVAADAAWAQLPPSLQLSGSFARRPCPDQGTRQQLATLLDLVVEEAADPLPARLLRAAFRLDHGDRDGAAADMQQVAMLAGSPYVREVAAWYGTSEASLEHPVPVAAPEHPPTTAPDRHVAAFLILRGERSLDRLRQGVALLRAGADRPSVAADELLALLLLEIQAHAPKAEQLGLCQQAHDVALRAQQRRGGVTATTAFVMASALTGQGRNQEALAHYRIALSLAPEHAGSRMNLGIALRRAGDPAAAVVELRRALAIRWDLPLAHESLMWSLLDLEDYAEALQVVAAMPLPAAPSGERRRALLRGRIAITKAVRSLAANDHDGAMRAATEACTQYETAGSELHDAFEAGLARALADEDLSAVSAGLLQGLLVQPTSWRQLDDFATLLPDALGVEQTTLLREYLHTLARHLAPAAPTSIRTSPDSPNPTAADPAAEPRQPR